LAGELSGGTIEAEFLKKYWGNYNSPIPDSPLGISDAETPLHRAARDGYYQAVKFLVFKGADVNAGGNTYLGSPLHWAINQRAHKPIVKFLIEHGADIEATGYKDRTPLHEAAGYNLLSIVAMLINNGAQINPSDVELGTPLLDACYEGNLDIVKLLLDNGADLTVKDICGWAPLHHAACRGHVSIMNLLIEKGAIVNDRTYEIEKRFNAPNTYANYTPLHFAAKSENALAVKMLVENGADVNSIDFQGKTPLDHAIEDNRVETADFLKSRGGKTGAELRAEKSNGR
jgi:ankyrin repeat protein